MALMGVMVWTGCQVAEENVAGEEDIYTWTLVVKAQKMETKALAIGEGTEATTTEIKSVWEAGDEVAVYKSQRLIGTLTATPDADDPHQATLSGEVTTSDLTAGSTKLTLLTPRTTWNYSGQDGTLLDTDNSIEKKYHYTLASSVLVTEVSGNRITTAPASFVSQQSIYRLSFRYQKSTDSKVPITASSVTISGASNKLVQSRTISGSPVYGPLSVKLGTATADPFFVSIRNDDQTKEEALTFTVVDDGGYTYRGSKTIPASYKPNGGFVSVKNATLPMRLELAETTTQTTVAL